MSASSPAIKRIMQECKELRKNPSNFIVAGPLEDNLFEWHFTIAGADETEFEGGKYHGKFILPAQYPFKAPDIIMLTKSGRFEIGKKICLNFTGYHHELWQPAWTIRTMLTALRAFMETNAKGIGAISVDKEQRKKYAKLSLNYKCPKCDVVMKNIKFPIINDKNNNKNNDKNNDENNNNNNNNEQEPQQIEQIEEIEPIEEREQLNINEANVSTSSISSSTSSRKDKLLDSVTLFLVMVIAAILLKKFAFRVMDQL
eukprot:304571_1